MKNRFILLLLALISTAVRAQTFTPAVGDSIDFVITGTTPTTEDSVAWFLVAPYRRNLDDIIPLVDGRFTIKGRLPRGTFYQIGDYADNDLCFIVDDVPTDINLATGALTSGSDLQRRFIEAQMHERAIERTIEPWLESLADERKDAIMELYEGGQKPATAQDSADLARISSAIADLEADLRQTIRHNLDNIIPAYYLHVRYDKLSQAEKDEFMREDAPYSHHPAMERPWQRYWGEQTQRAATGQPFRDFEAETPDGTKHRLSEYADGQQYLLLDFWASWCGPCIASFLRMKQLHEQYKDSGLRILGISLDKDREAWLAAFNRHQLPWPALRSPSSTGTDAPDAADLYGITGIPSLVLIAPDGTVLAVDIEASELDAKLSEIFYNQ